MIGFGKYNIAAWSNAGAAFRFTTLSDYKFSIRALSEHSVSKGLLVVALG